MGQEVDLLVNYPRAKRDIAQRAAQKTEADRALARQFGKDFFDGDRSCGYGGFHYHPRFWEPVVPTFQAHWNIQAGDSVLDVGCAKGFMLHDFKRLIHGVNVAGVDVSSYAIENAMEDVKPFLRVASAVKLPFPDNSFDFVISITTLHNLDGDDLVSALKEVERVSRKGSFITVDAYRDEDEKERMYAWNLTAKTILHTEEWKRLFKDVGYSGDYYWFMP